MSMGPHRCVVAHSPPCTFFRCQIYFLKMSNDRWLITSQDEPVVVLSSLDLKAQNILIEHSVSLQIHIQSDSRLSNRDCTAFKTVSVCLNDSWWDVGWCC